MNEKKEECSIEGVCVHRCTEKVSLMMRLPGSRVDVLGFLLNGAEAEDYIDWRMSLTTLRPYSSGVMLRPCVCSNLITHHARDENYALI